jgi:hypothetical protein
LHLLSPDVLRENPASVFLQFSHELQSAIDPVD